MPVNVTHTEYHAASPEWLRARDVLSGEDAIEAGGEKYVPRLGGQTDDEYAAYRDRASFLNATARTADGFIGLIFRRPPFVRLPDEDGAIGAALKEFTNDADMLGTSLFGYAKNLVTEVIGIGRAGSLVDWEDVEEGAYATVYQAEAILNSPAQR